MPANSAPYGCTQVQRTTAIGDDPVRASVRALAPGITVTSGVKVCQDAITKGWLLRATAGLRRKIALRARVLTSEACANPDSEGKR